MIGSINTGNRSVNNLNKIYGIKRSLTTSSSSWERIKDSVGLVANAQIGSTPVQNDFDNIYPWSDIITYNYDITARQITAYYGDPTFKFNGTNGEVLTKIPEFYWKRYRDEDYEYILISKNKLDGFIKSEEFSVGRYTMSGSNDHVYSRSGYQPLTENNINSFRMHARNLGPGFGQMDWHYFIIQMLYLVEYADYNSESKLGYGYASSSNTASVVSGGCDFLGMKSGIVDGSFRTSMIYRGIEDLFGNIWQAVDGINISNNQVYICYDSNKYNADTFSHGYQLLGYMKTSQSGFVSKVGYDPLHPMVMLPIETLGSGDTNMCDYTYAAEDGNHVVFVGGAWGHDSPKPGLWFWGFIDSASSAYVNVGARLLKLNL